jgi:hypothetical protein
MIETCILLLFMVASPTKLNETWNQTNTRTALERLYQDHDTGASPWDDHFFVATPLVRCERRLLLVIEIGGERVVEVEP